jgi:hypothetical protein
MGGLAGSDAMSSPATMRAAVAASLASTEWECTKCTLRNVGSDRTCAVCRASRPVSTAPAAVAAMARALPAPPPAGSTLCTNATCANRGMRTVRWTSRFVCSSERILIVHVCVCARVCVCVWQGDAARYGLCTRCYNLIAADREKSEMAVWLRDR